MTKMTCATCRYVDETSDAAGLCRKNPPVVPHDDTNWGVWPRVILEEDWCGGHLYKLKPGEVSL